MRTWEWGAGDGRVDVRFRVGNGSAAAILARRRAPRTRLVDGHWSRALPWRALRSQRQRRGGDVDRREVDARPAGDACTPGICAEDGNEEVEAALPRGPACRDGRGGVGVSPRSFCKPTATDLRCVE
jgi:hypothetical protein